jgi:HD superfamily phosphohydrolase
LKKVLPEAAMVRYFRHFYTVQLCKYAVEFQMPVTDFPFALQIKDPIHGYIGLSEVERELMDHRVSQRLRRIKGPAGLSLVYPGADIALLGRTLGFLQMTRVFLENLGGTPEEIQKGRLVSYLLMLANGPWANVMEEHLTIRGMPPLRLAKVLVDKTEVGKILEKHGFTNSEIKDVLERGVPVKGVRLDIRTCPINPELIDDLERDSYFAGVDYAQLEYNRLFDSTRITKNKIAVERGSLFTLEAYLSAAVNMFDAVYFHKTVRAAELMLLRILEEAGSQLFPSPLDATDEFFNFDDLTILYRLLHVSSDEPEELKEASHLFSDYSSRHLIKLVSARTISDPVFLSRLSRPDGLFSVEQEIADDAGIDSRNVYVDFPDRPSVTFYPGKFDLDKIALFERGSGGYEFWKLSDMSLLARSFSRIFKPVRVYTTRGYRSKLKKSADRVLESVDAAGST